jgi:hypothetical protein
MFKNIASQSILRLSEHRELGLRPFCSIVHLKTELFKAFQMLQSFNHIQIFSIRIVMILTTIVQFILAKLGNFYPICLPICSQTLGNSMGFIRLIFTLIECRFTILKQLFTVVFLYS